MALTNDDHNYRGSALGALVQANPDCSPKEMECALDLGITRYQGRFSTYPLAVDAAAKDISATIAHDTPGLAFADLREIARYALRGDRVCVWASLVAAARRREQDREGCSVPVGGGK